MAKKRASKAADKSTAGAKQHAPAMYPDPATIEIKTPINIVPVDLKTGTWRIDGPTPPEMLAIVEAERHRLNLTARIKQHALTCALRIEPYWGDRPKHISAAKWRNREHRVKLMTELPKTAPAEAHDALLALQTLNRMASELAEANDWPDSIDRALCYAIDFGQLLQRGQTQIDYGKIVDTGKRSKQSLNKGPVARTTKSEAKAKAARDELIKRLDGNNRSVSDHLIEMAKLRTWGGLRRLKSYCKGITRSAR